MRICHISNSLPTYHYSWGGAEQACLRTANLLSKRNENIENFVLSLSPIREVKENFRFFSVPVIEKFLPKFLANSISSLKSYFFPFDPLAFRFFDKFFKEQKPDIVHLHKFSILSFATISAAKKNKIPVIHSIYDYWIFCPLGFCWKIEDFYTYEGSPCDAYQGSQCLGCIEKARKTNFFSKIFLKIVLPLRKKLFDRYIKKIDKFIILSETNRKILLNYGIPEEKIVVVPLPFPFQEDFKIKPEEIDKNTILYLGSLHPHKGPLVAVDALKYVVEEIPQAKLYMVIDKEANDFVKERIRKNNLEKNIEISIIRKKFEEGVREYLKRALVFIISEQGETTVPYTLIEGMAFAKGIVASNVSGCLDYIRDGQNGFLAEYNNPQSYALKIIEFLKNPQLAFTLGQQAQEDIQKINSEERVGESLINLYKSLCQK